MCSTQLQTFTLHCFVTSHACMHRVSRTHGDKGSMETLADKSTCMGMCHDANPGTFLHGTTSAYRTKGKQDGVDSASKTPKTYQYVTLNKPACDWVFSANVNSSYMSEVASWMPPFPFVSACTTEDGRIIPLRRRSSGVPSRTLHPLFHDEACLINRTDPV